MPESLQSNCDGYGERKILQRTKTTGQEQGRDRQEEASLGATTESHLGLRQTEGTWRVKWEEKPNRRISSLHRQEERAVRHVPPPTSGPPPLRSLVWLAKNSRLRLEAAKTKSWRDGQLGQVRFQRERVQCPPLTGGPRMADSMLSGYQEQGAVLRE